jgi:hypothetical protein
MGAGRNRFDGAVECVLSWARRWGIDEEVVLSGLKGCEIEILSEVGEDTMTWDAFQFFYRLAHPDKA